MEASASAAPIVAPLPQPTLEASKASYIELRRQKQSMLHPTGSEHTKNVMNICISHCSCGPIFWLMELMGWMGGQPFDIYRSN